MKRLIPLVLALCWLSVAAFSQNEKALSAEQILKEMLAVYESCTSYVDEGQVETVFLTKDRPWTNIRPFRTAFNRSSSFYFEFKQQNFANSPWHTYMVWEDKEGAHKWWSIQPKIEPIDNLRLALAGANGVSGGSAYNIPHLLRADLKQGGHKFVRMSELEITREEIIQNKTAFRIEGKDSLGAPITLWIDEQDFLLLKIYEKRKVYGRNGENFETETTTTYQPQINIEIPADKFKITIPPK